jgi:hypothetical protein
MGKLAKAYLLVLLLALAWSPAAFAQIVSPGGGGPAALPINNPTFTGTLTGPSINISSLGGTCTAGQFMDALSTTGAITCATPAAGGGASVTVSLTPPASPAIGNLWFNTVDAQTYIWYNDGTSSQWVPVINTPGGGGGGGGGGLPTNNPTFTGTLTGPNISISSLGGTCTSGQYMSALSTTGAVTCGTPAGGGGLPTATAPYLTLQSSATNAAVWNKHIGIDVAPMADDANGSYPLVATGNLNNQYQITLRNLTAGNNAATAVQLQNDLGTTDVFTFGETGSSTNWGGIWRSSMGFIEAYNAGGLLLYSDNGPLMLNTVTANQPIQFFTDGNGGVRQMQIDTTGVQVGAPTGGGKGVGTVNATGLYINGVAVSTGGGGGLPTGAPPQFVGYPASGATGEAETLSGDAALTRAAAGSYTIAVTKTNGVAFTALATAAVPLTIANGGTGATTAAAALTNLGAAPINNPTFTGTVTIPAGATISGYLPINNPTATGTLTTPVANVTSVNGAASMYFGSMTTPTAALWAGNGNAMSMQAGTYYNGTNYIATSTDAVFFLESAGQIAFYGNHGLTVGSPFTVTQMANLATTGFNLMMGTYQLNGVNLLPISIANGGTGASTAPTTGQALVATSTTAYAPTTLTQTNLSDYSIGPWTPQLNFGGCTTGITYATNTGNYVKIGKFIHAELYQQLTSQGSCSSSAVAQIGGLPYAFANNGTSGIGSCTIGVIAGLTGVTGDPLLLGVAGATQFGMWMNNPNGSGATQILYSNFAASTRYNCSIDYMSP